MFLRAPSARKRLTALLAVTALSGGLGMAAAFDQMPNLSGESRHAGDRLMDASGGSCRGEGPTPAAVQLPIMMMRWCSLLFMKPW